MNLLFIDLHCDALLPAGAGEFGGGNTYSKSVLDLIAKHEDINCLYVTRKKVAGLTGHIRLTGNIDFYRVKIGEYDLKDKDSLFLHADRAAEKILEILQENSFVPDIIHSSYWPSGLASLKINKVYHVKQIHTPLSNGKRKLLQTGHYAIEKPRITSEENIYRSSDYVVCSSKAELRDINELYGIPAEKLVMAGLDVNDYFRFPTYLKNGDFLIKGFRAGQEPEYIAMTGAPPKDVSEWWNSGSFLYFGRLHEDKGILQIITAWLELYGEYGNFPSLWIAGGSPEQIAAFRGMIKDQVLLRKAEDRQKLIWWGRLSPEGISTLLLKTLAVTTHSKYETGGLMILETLASGKPVIATPYGFAKDFLKDWYNGFIIDFGDLKKLKLRMANFFMQPLLSSGFRENVIKSFNEAEEAYGFRKKHLRLYGADSGAGASSMVKRSVQPYPLQEHIPEDAEIISALRNILAREEKSSCGDMGIAGKIIHKAVTVWELNCDDSCYYCARWKNRSSHMRIFRSSEPYFYTARGQYLDNKAYIKNNTDFRDAYFDDENKLIFIKGGKGALNQNPDNFVKFLSGPVYPGNRADVFDLGAFIGRIEDTLHCYRSFFEGCEREIRSILDFAGSKKAGISGKDEYVLFPKETGEVFFIGDRPAFINGCILVEKTYGKLAARNAGAAAEDGEDEKYRVWSALFQCEEQLLKSIISGEADAEAYRQIKNSCEKSPGF